MFVAYCKTCKEVTGWCDVEKGLDGMKHASGEYEIVDSGTKNENDEPIMVQREVLHDCGTFEIVDFPENATKEWIEENYEESMS